MIRISPSRLERLAACPGSYLAEKGLPDRPNPYNEEGELLHSALAHPTLQLELKLMPAQRRDIEVCRTEGYALLRRVFGDAKITHMRERRVRTYLNNEGDAISGRLDFIAYDSSGRACVIDWKFGRGDVEIAADNYQLRASAVLATEFGAKEVWVAIVQPRAPREHRTTVCEYTTADLGEARAEIRGIAEAVTKFGGRRIPGEQCRYCLAVGTENCRESAEALVALERPKAPMPTGKALSDLLLKIAPAEAAIKALKEHAAIEIAAGREVPGWTLESAASRRKIPDALGAWKQVQDLLMPEQFAAACAVRVGELQEAWCEATGLTGDPGKKAFNEAMGGALKWDTPEPSLKRVKE